MTRKTEHHDKTDFPKHGDDEPVSLKRSHFPLFSVAFARDLKENWPEIWEEGGNIKGDEQFDTLAPIAKRGGAAHGTDEVEAVKLREAWAARHLKDFRLAGTVAQIKWLVVGDCGEAHMKQLIDEEKERIRGKREKEGHADD